MSLESNTINYCDFSKCQSFIQVTVINFIRNTWTGERFSMKQKKKRWKIFYVAHSKKKEWIRSNFLLEFFFSFFLIIWKLNAMIIDEWFSIAATRQTVPSEKASSLVYALCSAVSCKQGLRGWKYLCISIFLFFFRQQYFY